MSRCVKMTALASLLALCAVAQEYTVFAKTAKPSARYAVGEEIVFVVTATDANKKGIAGKELGYTLTGDGGMSEKGKVVTTAEGVEIKTRLNQPGFVLLRVDAPKEQKRRPVLAGAGVDPEKLPVYRHEPADFDTFWAKTLADIKSRNKDVKATVTRIDRYPKAKGADMADVYDVRLEDGVLNATGEMVIPKNVPQGTMPIIISFNGASKVGVDAAGLVNQAVAYKSICYIMNLHDTVNNIPKDKVWDFRRLPMINGYQFRDADKLEAYGIRDVFYRIIRSLEYLKSRPEWDGKRIIARGGSLGGAQTIFTAAMEPKCVFAVACAPALCTHLGYKDKLNNGWPGVMDKAKYKAEPKRSAAEKVVQYYDIANFAKRVKCPIVMSAGFIDTTCSPTSIYVAYNSLGTQDKKMYDVPLGDHGNNYDPSPTRVPGVFSYGGREVQEFLGIIQK